MVSQQLVTFEFCHSEVYKPKWGNEMDLITGKTEN